MSEPTKQKIILRNDAKKEKQCVSFSIPFDLHLDIQDLKTIVERNTGKKINLKDFMVDVMVKGAREFFNK